MLEALERDLPREAGQFAYLGTDDGYPTYRNTGLSYYALGEEGFPHMLADVERAERFVFLEYFIIERGRMWDSLHEALARKAAQGVDVRVIYDDIGSVYTLPGSYARELEREGIKCVSFNRLHPLVNVFVNHRDHRKIMVVDGVVSYTGGVNLADEYVNLRNKFGHWKDNVLRVEGEAVWSHTVMFLTTWNALRHEDDDLEQFRTSALTGEPDGFICPYAETPLTSEMVGQDVYLNIINQATRYCYIMTPYLIIDTDMQNALILAAKRGVDVRIITPHIPDKKTVFLMTRSNYRPLVADGVKIYEYTPGFIHAKNFLADDCLAVCGSINLDYRSLVHHFECGVWMYGTDCIRDMRRDFLDTVAVSQEITEETAVLRGLPRLGAEILKVLTPLM